MAIQAEDAMFLGAVAATATLFVLALKRRSWSLWLGGYGLLVLTLGVSWLARGR